MSQAQTFPTSKLQLNLLQGRQGITKAIVLVACGSFNPLTYMHLRMMEVARQGLMENNPTCVVIGGYLSPVNDQYRKKGLLPGINRIKMCELGVASSDWLDVDPWEALQETYVRTFHVLQHVSHEIEKYVSLWKREILCESSKEIDLNFSTEVRLVLGADVFLSMTTHIPDTNPPQPAWSLPTLEPLLKDFSFIVVSRDNSAHSQVDAVFETTLRDSTGSGISINFADYRNKFLFIWNTQERNDLSSTLVRQYLQKGISIRYLVPAEVERYLLQNQLY